MRGSSPCDLRTQMIGDLFDSPWKIAIVAVVIIVLFGSRKLPDAARSLGQSMRILKTEVQGLHEDDARPRPPARRARSRRPGPAPGPSRARRDAGRAGADRRAEQAARRPPAVGRNSFGQRAGQVGLPARRAVPPNPSGNDAIMAAKPSAIRGARIVGERYVRAKRQAEPGGAHAPVRPPARAAQPGDQGRPGDHRRHRSSRWASPTGSGTSSSSLTATPSRYCKVQRARRTSSYSTA